MKKLFLLLLLLPLPALAQFNVNGSYNSTAVSIYVVPQYSYPSVPVMSHWWDSQLWGGAVGDWTFDQYYEDVQVVAVNQHVIAPNGQMADLLTVIRGQNGTTASNKGVGNTDTYSMFLFNAGSLTPTLSFTPTNTLSPTPTGSATPTVTLSPTWTGTPTWTFTPTVTSTPTDYHVWTLQDRWNMTWTAAPTGTITPTNTPTATPTFTQTATPTFTPTQTPTFTTTSTPTQTPTVTMTATITNTPTVTNTPWTSVSGSSVSITGIAGTSAVSVTNPFSGASSITNFPAFPTLPPTPQIPVSVVAPVSITGIANPVPILWPTATYTFTSTYTFTPTPTGSATPTVTSTPYTNVNCNSGTATGFSSSSAVSQSVLPTRVPNYTITSFQGWSLSGATTVTFTHDQGTPVPGYTNIPIYGPGMSFGWPPNCSPAATGINNLSITQSGPATLQGVVYAY